MACIANNGRLNVPVSGHLAVFVSLVVKNVTHLWNINHFARLAACIFSAGYEHFLFKLPVILRDFVIVINFSLFLAIDIGSYHVSYCFILRIIPPHTVYFATCELSADESIITSGVLMADRDQCSYADE